MTSPIILALDYSDLNEAHKIISLVRPHIGMIKIGLEMFVANGFESLSLSKDYNIPVFLDLKLKDVPTTINKTIAVICERLSLFNGDHFLSIHADGGFEMCKGAVDTANNSNVAIAAVTLLTSLKKEDMNSLNIKGVVSNLVTDAGLVAESAGVTHFICPPASVKNIKKYITKNNSVFICPGIRSSFDEPNDHKRSETPSSAIKGGANWLVVGRPITQALDPLKAAGYILDQANKGR